MSASKGIVAKIYRSHEVPAGVTPDFIHLVLVVGTTDEAGKVVEPVEPEHQVQAPHGVPAPEVVVVRHFDHGRPAYYARPRGVPGVWVWGGTFIYTSATGFANLTGIAGAVPFHDQVER